MTVEMWSEGMLSSFIHLRVRKFSGAVRVMLWGSLLLIMIVAVITLAFLTIPGLWKVGTWLHHCPLGHRNVRVVKVLYGLVALDIEGERRVKDREIVLGGCVMDAMSPAYCGICVDCGARYDASSRVWTISSEDPQAGFPEPLAWPLLEMTSMLKNRFLFNQEVLKGTVVAQNASAWCPLNQSELTSFTTSVERVLNVHQVACNKSEPVSGNHSIRYKWVDDGQNYSILLDHLPPDDLDGRIYIMIACEDTDYLDKTYGAMLSQDSWLKRWPGYVTVFIDRRGILYR